MAWATAIWFGRERVFRWLLQIPALRPEYEFASGAWNIWIEFDDNDGAGLQVRTGTIEVTHRILGINIRGNRLMNNKTSETTMNGWYAENIDVVTYEDHQLLAYLYKVPIIDSATVIADDVKFEKIGFVCAFRKKDKDVFEGEFRDIRVRHDVSRVREGKIRLSRG